MRSVLGMRRRVKEREDRSVGQVKGLPVVHDVYVAANLESQLV